MKRKRDFIYFGTSHTLGEVIRDILLAIALILSWTAVILGLLANFG